MGGFEPLTSPPPSFFFLSPARSSRAASMASRHSHHPLHTNPHNSSQHHRRNHSHLTPSHLHATTQPPPLLSFPFSFVRHHTQFEPLTQSRRPPQPQPSPDLTTATTDLLLMPPRQESNPHNPRITQLVLDQNRATHPSITPRISSRTPSHACVQPPPSTSRHSSNLTHTRHNQHQTLLLTPPYPPSQNRAHTHIHTLTHVHSPTHSQAINTTFVRTPTTKNGLNSSHSPDITYHPLKQSSKSKKQKKKRKKERKRMKKKEKESSLILVECKQREVIAQFRE